MRSIWPWRRHREMNEKLEEEKFNTAVVQHEVVRPLQEKRKHIEHNGYAQLVAEGLGMVRKRE